MEQDSQTFPTFRTWRGMSESEQDALLDRIEASRRWRAIRSRAVVAGLCAAIAITGVALVLAP
jgi:hypothetical protein